jgi:hypothetical protein
MVTVRNPLYNGCQGRVIAFEPHFNRYVVELYSGSNKSGVAKRLYLDPPNVMARNSTAAPGCAPELYKVPPPIRTDDDQGPGDWLELRKQVRSEFAWTARRNVGMNPRASKSRVSPPAAHTAPFLAHTQSGRLSLTAWAGWCPYLGHTSFSTLGWNSSRTRWHGHLSWRTPTFCQVGPSASRPTYSVSAPQSTRWSPSVSLSCWGSHRGVAHRRSGWSRRTLGAGHHCHRHHRHHHYQHQFQQLRPVLTTAAATATTQVHVVPARRVRFGPTSNHRCIPAHMGRASSAIELGSPGNHRHDGACLGTSVASSVRLILSSAPTPRHSLTLSSYSPLSRYY